MDVKNTRQIIASFSISILRLDSYLGTNFIMLRITLPEYVVNFF